MKVLKFIFLTSTLCVYVAGRLQKNDSRHLLAVQPKTGGTISHEAELRDESIRNRDPTCRAIQSIEQNVLDSKNFPAYRALVTRLAEEGRCSTVSKASAHGWSVCNEDGPFNQCCDSAFGSRLQIFLEDRECVLKVISDATLLTDFLGGELSPVTMAKHRAEQFSSESLSELKYIYGEVNEVLDEITESTVKILTTLRSPTYNHALSVLRFYASDVLCSLCKPAKSNVQQSGVALLLKVNTEVLRTVVNDTIPGIREYLNTMADLAQAVISEGGILDQVLQIRERHFMVFVKEMSRTMTNDPTISSRTLLREMQVLSDSFETLQKDSMFGTEATKSSNEAKTRKLDGRDGDSPEESRKDWSKTKDVVKEEDTEDEGVIETVSSDDEETGEGATTDFPPRKVTAIVTEQPSVTTESARDESTKVSEDNIPSKETVKARVTECMYHSGVVAADTGYVDDAKLRSALEAGLGDLTMHDVIVQFGLGPQLCIYDILTNILSLLPDPRSDATFLSEVLDASGLMSHTDGPSKATPLKRAAEVMIMSLANNMGQGRHAQLVHDGLIPPLPRKSDKLKGETATESPATASFLSLSKPSMMHDEIKTILAGATFSEGRIKKGSKPHAVARRATRDTFEQHTRAVANTNLDNKVSMLALANAYMAPSGEQPVMVVFSDDGPNPTNDSHHRSTSVDWNVQGSVIAYSGLIYISLVVVALQIVA